MSAFVGSISNPGGFGPGGENDPFFGGAAGAAAEEAAALQAATTEKGLAETRRQFDITQANFEPIRQAGLGALESQQALIGLSGADAQQQAFTELQESPGQKFIRENLFVKGGVWFDYFLYSFLLKIKNGDKKIFD